jgi:hypothetical protein
VLLLYGKPTTRIAALRTTDIRTTPRRGHHAAARFGEIPLPEPLAAVAKALRDHQLQRTAMGGWLIPGRHAGQHITADRLQQRLKRYGIERSREGRHAALLALAARLPAPILAERIGIPVRRCCMGADGWQYLRPVRGASLRGPRPMRSGLIAARVRLLPAEKVRAR